MKKTFNLIITAIILAMGVLVSCHENIIDETTSSAENGLVPIRGYLDLPAGYSSVYEGYTVQSLNGAAEIKDGSFKLRSYDNGQVQTFVVEENNRVYLMSRTPVSRGQQIDLSVQSTAIAMVTAHPLFSPIGTEDYSQLTSLIIGSPKFQAFYDEVERTITERRHLYDETNEEMLLAFSDLMEELCGESEDDGNYEDSLDEVDGTRASAMDARAVYQHSQINPTYIDAQINGSTLTLRTVWVTPSYYGTVSQPNGQVTNKVIPSRGDFGIADLINNRTTRGEPMEWDFYAEGDYRFSFSRMNAEATLDFYMRIAGSILNTLGLPITGNDDAIVEAAKYISNAIAAAGSGVSDAKMSAMDWLGIAYDAATSQISTTGKLGSYTFPQAAVNVAKTLAGSFNWYNKIKGIANTGLRLAYALDAPETINFCLCYYNNEVTTCTEAKLHMVSGNDQIGYANQKLLLPLKVYVQTIGDDGLYYSSSSYHRVKFEVVSGGGKVDFDLVAADLNNTASTYWTLGTEGEQTVKATVVDIITEKEISEPVYFKAELNNADVTIRLDWSKNSGDTDIDLHVYDPFGEEISFYNMRSASGGYLDRDDVVGPGPEHVRWSNAPVGTYKIYVHYYPNEAEDRSVTTYKVSVTADGITYRPKIGSIAYNQYVPVGQFTIGESSGTRTITSVELEDTTPINKKTFPKK